MGSTDRSPATLRAASASPGSRAEWVLVLLLTLGLHSPAHAQEFGTVAGRVVDGRGRGLEKAQVFIQGAERGALSDRTGAFRITGVPLGEHVLRADLLGYLPGLRKVRLPGEDALDVTLVLTESRISISGSGLPLPESDLMVDGERLLPRVLAAPGLSAILSSEWARGDTITVWTPWGVGGVVIGARPVLRVISECNLCVAAVSYTVEGGAMYRAGIRHVRVGVTQPDASPRLTFCIDPAERGDVLMRNCYGSGRTVLLHYVRLEDGEWIRYDRE